MRVTAILNMKGGVGKTTTAVNMAAILARDHKARVLLIDADSQCNTTEFFGADPKGGNLADILRQKEQKDRPVIEYIQDVYTRIGALRQSHGITMEQLFKAEDVFYTKADAERQNSLESGKEKLDTDTKLPFGYGFYARDAQHLCAVADLLHCSVDYLLGRSSDPEQATPWHTGKPWNVGEYVAMVRHAPKGSPRVYSLHWDGSSWLEYGMPLEEIGAEVLLWTEMPEVE